MDLYHQCPKRFEVQKIDGGYEPSGEAALLGTFVHRILELLMEHPPEERTIDTAKECAKKAWLETVIEPDFVLLDLTEDQRRAFRWSGWHSVENYFAMEDPTQVEVESTEEWVECTIEGVNMRGIVDRLDRFGDDLVVTDYKNGKVPDPKYRASKWEQLNFYAAMIDEIKGERPASGRLIFTAHSEILDTEFTDKSVDNIVTKVRATWTAIEEDFQGRGFKTKTGPLCAWCPVMPTCPPGAAEVTMRMRKGRVREDAPGYAMIKAMQQAG
jgi:putative RecB family exonuclease